MKKLKGFSILELLVAMTIFGILGAITAPKISSWSNQQKFRDTYELFVDYLATTRMNALLEKKCNDKVTEKWFLEMKLSDETETNYEINVKCRTTETTPTEHIIDSKLIAKNFAKFSIFTSDLSNSYTEYTDTGNSFVLEFIPHAYRITINDKTDNYLSLKKAKFQFMNLLNPNKIKTICFSQITGLFYYSESGDCTED